MLVRYRTTLLGPRDTDGLRNSELSTPDAPTERRPGHLSIMQNVSGQRKKLPTSEFGCK